MFIMCQKAPENHPVTVFVTVLNRKQFFAILQFCQKSYKNKTKSLETVKFQGKKLELIARFELATSSLPRMRSTY